MYSTNFTICGVGEAHLISLPISVFRLVEREECSSGLSLVAKLLRILHFLGPREWLKLFADSPKQDLWELSSPGQAWEGSTFLGLRDLESEDACEVTLKMLSSYYYLNIFITYYRPNAFHALFHLPFTTTQRWVLSSPPFNTEAGLREKWSHFSCFASQNVNSVLQILNLVFLALPASLFNVNSNNIMGVYKNFFTWGIQNARDCGCWKLCGKDSRPSSVASRREGESIGGAEILLILFLMNSMLFLIKMVLSVPGWLIYILYFCISWI